MNMFLNLSIKENTLKNVKIGKMPPWDLLANGIRSDLPCDLTFTIDITIVLITDRSRLHRLIRPHKIQ